MGAIIAVALQHGRPSVVSCLRAEASNFRATDGLAHVPKWHPDRMIIVGDAAHPASPSSEQGASMAIEGGFELSRCLRDMPDALTAFDAYDS